MAAGVRKIPPPTTSPENEERRVPQVQAAFEPALGCRALRNGGSRDRGRAHAAAGRRRMPRACATVAGSRPTSRAMRTTRSTKRAFESASSPLR